MFGIVDCNNFYASCERVFNPKLEGRPVVVLSNNDGCVIARSAEAKALGIPMGAPYFEVKQMAAKHKVAVFSSNYTLYGDMSARVMQLLNEMAPVTEVYSIDECFLGLEGMNAQQMEHLAGEITRRVRKETGIPVSVGIAPTKTLSKMANKMAKKNKNQLGRGYHVLSEAKEIEKALKDFPLEDVWGIGRQYYTFLHGKGITSPWAFTQLPESYVRKHMTVVGHRLYKELKGISCRTMEEEIVMKKGIGTFKSFGHLMTEEEDLRTAMASYAASVAVKLRKYKLCTSLLQVTVATDPFRENQPQYYRTLSIPLKRATQDTQELVHYALRGLKYIFRKGYAYKRVGVMLSGIVPESQVQGFLFDTRDRAKSQVVNGLLDGLEKRFGRDSLKLAAMGTEIKWSLRQDLLSPAYTTRWSDLPVIKMG